MTAGSVRTSSADRLELHHLFVYGTLRPGDVRWPLLAPFAVDEGWPDSVPGRLFDTGLDYPAAIFDDRADPGGRVMGQTYALLRASLGSCLDVLDREEGTVGGLYRRVVVRTDRGVDAYAYEYGDHLELTPIDSGDWFAHRAVVAPAVGPAGSERRTLAP